VVRIAQGGRTALVVCGLRKRLENMTHRPVSLALAARTGVGRPLLNTRGSDNLLREAKRGKRIAKGHGTALRLPQSVFPLAPTALDFKTAPGPSRPIATFMNGDADHFRDQAFDGETHGRVLARQCRKRARGAANHIATVSFDVSHGAKVLVQ
jgi:hypothetical protein